MEDVGRLTDASKSRPDYSKTVLNPKAKPMENMDETEEAPENGVKHDLSLDGLFSDEPAKLKIEKIPTPVPSAPKPDNQKTDRPQKRPLSQRLAGLFGFFVRPLQVAWPILLTILLLGRPWNLAMKAWSRFAEQRARRKGKKSVPLARRLTWLGYLLRAWWKEFLTGFKYAGSWAFGGVIKAKTWKQRGFAAVRLLLLGGILYWAGLQIWGSEAVIARLRNSAIYYRDQGDWEASARQFQKWYDMSPGRDASMTSAYLDVLKQLDDPQRLEKFLATVAPGPGEQTGDPTAHCWKAIELSSQISAGQPVDLNSLRWHLKNAEGNGLGLHLANARYHLAMREMPMAADHFQRAAQFDPIYFLNVARIYEMLEKEELRRQALLTAKEAMQKPQRGELSVSDLSSAVLPGDQLGYAEVLFQLEEFESCEEYLLKLADNGLQSKNAVVQFYLKQALKNQGQVEQQVGLLARAFQVLPNSNRVHRLVQQVYSSQIFPEKKELVLQTWMNLAKNQSLQSTASFLLGQLHASDGNVSVAKDYAKLAFDQNPESDRYAHLLAWIYCHQRTPEIEQAESLARQAVLLDPKNPRYRKTLGEVLLKMKDAQQASLQFELAFKNLGSKGNPATKGELHRLLAKSYQLAGRNDLAASHEKASRKLMTN